MTWRLRVVHRSGYSYAAPVTASYNEARMTPMTDLHQMTVSADVTVTPGPSSVLRYWDYWGTQVTAFDLHHPHEQLEITSTAVVETEPPASTAELAGWEVVRSGETADRFHELLMPTRYAPDAEELRRRSRELAAGLNPAEAAVAILEWVHGALQYESGVTAVHSSAIEALEAGSGVCQDYAHLALVLLRAAGLPSRYVSGYFHPVAEAPRAETVVGQSHAWVETFVGSWRGYDPTNNLPIGEQHIIVGRGRDYADVPPLRGVFSGGPSSALGVDVLITRL